MLKMSTKGEYGVRAMVKLGLLRGGSLTVQEISERHGISAKYLEHILASLKKAGLVQSERGSKGGYRLARSPRDITLADVLFALEGRSAPVGCLREEVQQTKVCYWQEKCALQDVWLKIQQDIIRMLKSITLEEICNKQREICEKKTVYHI